MIKDGALRGIGWMFLVGVLFVGVTALVKTLGDGLPAAQSGFLRYLIGLALLPFFFPGLRDSSGAKALWRPAILRGIIHSVAVVLWFFAMTRIPIAEVTSLNYLSPVYVTLGAAMFMGERLALRRLLAIAAALIGAVLILRPGFRELSLGHLAMLGAAVCFAGSYLIGKHLTSAMSPSWVVIWLSVTVTVGLAPAAALSWTQPSGSALLTITAVAVLATLGHFAMSLAFRAAPLGVTQPVTFLQLVWATLLGALVFEEPADPYVVTGGALIIAAVSYIAWRETRVRR